MEAPRVSRNLPRMRLYWNHIWKSKSYQRASADERRLIEIRFCLARALQRKRRACRLTQRKLAARLDLAQATISRVERASNRVSLDVAVRALITLGCSDAELAALFDPSSNPGVRQLRNRAAIPFYPKPRTEEAPRPEPGEQRFLRKGTEVLRRKR